MDSLGDTPTETADADATSTTDDSYSTHMSDAADDANNDGNEPVVLVNASWEGYDFGTRDTVATGSPFDVSCSLEPCPSLPTCYSPAPNPTNGSRNTSRIARAGESIVAWLPDRHIYIAELQQDGSLHRWSRSSLESLGLLTCGHDHCVVMATSAMDGWGYANPDGGFGCGLVSFETNTRETSVVALSRQCSDVAGRIRDELDQFSFVSMPPRSHSDEEGRFWCTLTPGHTDPVECIDITDTPGARSGSSADNTQVLRLGEVFLLSDPLGFALWEGPDRYLSLSYPFRDSGRGYPTVWTTSPLSFLGTHTSAQRDSDTILQYTLSSGALETSTVGVIGAYLKGSGRAGGERETWIGASFLDDPFPASVRVVQQGDRIVVETPALDFFNYGIPIRTTEGELYHGAQGLVLRDFGRDGEVLWRITGQPIAGEPLLTSEGDLYFVTHDGRVCHARTELSADPQSACPMFRCSESRSNALNNVELDEGLLRP